ncbi:MAG TPA: HU family DNA-binding protein [Paludibacteraceae bacterium]|jgi:nucleoid DNA-binding protein|nr:HU family DNA-binding protein [Paludibacteraceae bacterium]
MSKEKISMQEIVDLMVVHRNMTRKSAEEFVRQLLSTIEDALLEGDSVKISGFGTFKPQWNEPRKSIDVNTGNEIIIEGFYKVAFVPDNELKELINEPYSHLEAIEIGNKAEDIIESEPENDNFKQVIEPMRVFEEQAEEIKNLLNEIGALSTNKMTAKKEKSSVEKAIEPAENLIETPVEVMDDVENIVLADDELDNRVIAEEEELSQPELTEKPEVIAEETMPIIIDREEEPVSDIEDAKVIGFSETAKQISIEAKREQDTRPDDFDIIREGGKIIFPGKKSTVDNTHPEPELVADIKPQTEQANAKNLMQDEIVAEETLPADLIIENSPEISQSVNHEPPYFAPESPVNDEGEVLKQDVTPKSVVETVSDTEKAATDTVSVPYVPESVIEDSTDAVPFEEIKKRPVWIYILSVLALLALAAVAAWFYYPGIFNNLNNKTAQTLPKVAEQTNLNPVEPVIPDTLAAPNALPDTIINVFDAPRQFTEYIATEPMKRGSMLSIFAKKHLGHPYFWVYIYEANKDIIQDPNNVPLGVDIKIPKVDPRLIDVNNPECVQFALKLSEQYLK